MKRLPEFKKRMLKNSLAQKGHHVYFRGGTMHEKNGLEDNLSILFDQFPKNQANDYNGLMAQKLLRVPTDWLAMFITFFDDGSYDVEQLKFKGKISEMEDYTVDYARKSLEEAKEEFKASLDEDGFSSERKPISMGFLYYLRKDIVEHLELKKHIPHFVKYGYQDVEKCNIANEEFYRKEKEKFI